MEDEKRYELERLLNDLSNFIYRKMDVTFLISSLYCFDVKTKTIFKTSFSVTLRCIYRLNSSVHVMQRKICVFEDQFVEIVS